MEAKNYAARVADKGKKHDYGPPHPHILRAFAEKAMERVEGVADPDGDVSMMDEEEKKVLQAKKLSAETEVGRQIGSLLGYIDGHRSPTELAESIPYFRVKECYSPKGTKETDKRAVVTWCFKENSEYEKALIAACGAVGGARQVGPAPRSAMERLMEAALDKLK